MLEIIETAAAPASKNMEWDAALLENAESRSSPILHLYEWEAPSLTYGCFVNPAQFLHVDEVRKRGIEMAKRPTGGGIVFHIWDLAFSVLVPSSSPHFSKNVLENYHLVNRAVQAAVLAFVQKSSSPQLLLDEQLSSHTPLDRFCMAKPTKYDVLIAGKKVAGAAQRTTKAGFLHQGSIALRMPDFALLSTLLLSQDVLSAMKEVTYPLVGENPSQNEIKEAKMALRSLLTHYLKQELS